MAVIADDAAARLDLELLHLGQRAAGVRPDPEAQNLMDQGGWMSI